jgi:putative glutamine amidotransferase
MASDKPKSGAERPKIAIPEPCSYDREYSDRALPAYLRALELCGAEPVIVRLGMTPEEIARSLTRCAAVLLPGSKADIAPQKFNAAPHPKTAPADYLRDAADELLLQDAYNLHKPILGICYGLQSLNVWRSGTLLQHIETRVNHEARREAQFAHQVTVEGDSLLAREIELKGAGGIPVNSSHHQSADVAGDGLRVVGRCPDDGIVEALEGTSPDHYVLAVQWHPERSFEQDIFSRKLFESFIHAATEWHGLQPPTVAETK